MVKRMRSEIRSPRFKFWLYHVPLAMFCLSFFIYNGHNRSSYLLDFSEELNELLHVKPLEQQVRSVHQMLLITHSVDRYLLSAHYVLDIM